MTESNHEVRVWKRDAAGVVSEARDELAVEEPLEIRVRGKAVSVTMRTPGVEERRDEEDAELAAGFLLSEGVVRNAGDIIRIEPCGRPANRDGNIVNVFLSEACVFDPARLTRHVFASSSCGVCGKASIEALEDQFPPVRSELNVTPETLVAMPDALRSAQPRFGRTGGLHAAGLFDEGGALVVLREDVGRHNAVDKVLGWALRSGRLPLSAAVLLVSGRVSFEVVQKARAGGVPVLAAIGAPSSLAVRTAEDGGQTLIGFLRDGRMNVYTRPRRVLRNGEHPAA